MYRDYGVKIMLKKFVRLFTLKSLAAFALTFFLGVLINTLSGNYWFYFNVAETFTKAEAEAKLNRQVIAKCSGDTQTSRGTVVSYHQSQFDRQIVIGVKWDGPLLGKYGQLDVGKDFYERCVTEIN